MVSSRVMSGRMEGKRLASMDLPLPGGPTISTLCPPAAATSRARFTFSWPFTSEKSGKTASASVMGGAFCGAMGSSPLKWASSSFT